MLSFLIVKCLSLLFHAIDFHFIKINGHYEDAFAILYYIIFLMKDTLLLVTILLVGAIRFFFKDLLSLLFIAVIPLQILANVAQVIIQATEESNSDYTTWEIIFSILNVLLRRHLISGHLVNPASAGSLSHGQSSFALIEFLFLSFLTF